MNLTTSLFPAPDLDVGTATADFSSPALRTRLTLKNYATTFVDGYHSPYNDDLLTPPSTDPSLDEPPFRPDESDRTSLSMKRCYGSSQRRRRRHNRACMSSGDVHQTALSPSEFPKHIHPLSRSKSAPNFSEVLRVAFGQHETGDKSTLHRATTYTHDAELVPRGSSLPKIPQRWTMPGKAAPTRVLTSMSPPRVLTEHFGIQISDEGGSVDRAVSLETPAMITLQRAASCRFHKTSLRPEAYTSFPIPTFSKTRSDFVTTFFGDGWRRPDSTFIHTSIESVSVASYIHSPPSSFNRASVDCGNVRPSHNNAAGLVCTDVVLDPVIQGQTDEFQLESRVRRCSTRYVSGASAYEVIWDENVSTSSSSASRRTSEELARRIRMRDNDNIPERRHSVAIDKLETQLFKGTQQSRKTSEACRGHATPKEASPILYSANRRSFFNRLDFQQVGCNAEEEPDILPRSRASTMSKQKLTGPNMEVHLAILTDDETPTCHMDFFPLLLPSRTKFDMSNDPLLVNPWRTSWETGTATTIPASAKKADNGLLSPQRRGSMIGQSSGVRKKSVQRQRFRLEHKASMARRKKSKPVEDDRKPLLGQFSKWSSEVFPEGYRDQPLEHKPKP